MISRVKFSYITVRFEPVQNPHQTLGRQLWHDSADDHVEALALLVVIQVLINQEDKVLNAAR